VGRVYFVVGPDKCFSLRDSAARKPPLSIQSIKLSSLVGRRDLEGWYDVYVVFLRGRRRVEGAYRVWVSSFRDGCEFSFEFFEFLEDGEECGAEFSDFFECGVGRISFLHMSRLYHKLPLLSRGYLESWWLHVWLPG